MNGQGTKQDRPAAGRPDTGDLELLGRLLVGLAYLGSDELLARLRAIGPGVAADVEHTQPEDETLVELVSYLALGTFLRGGRRLARRARRGLDRSRRAAGWALGTADRLTSNRVARPLREPVERWLWATLLEGQQAIMEGRREAQTSRELAGRTVQEIVDDVVEAMIENPELMVSVERLVRQQSAGLTGTLVTNTRQMTASADDVAEGVVRRLLRRRPRPALSRQPVAVDGDALPHPGASMDDDDGAANDP